MTDHISPIFADAITPGSAEGTLITDGELSTVHAKAHEDGLTREEVRGLRSLRPADLADDAFAHYQAIMRELPAASSLPAPDFPGINIRTDRYAFRDGFFASIRDTLAEIVSGGDTDTETYNADVLWTARGDELGRAITEKHPQVFENWNRAMAGDLEAYLAREIAAHNDCSRKAATERAAYLMAGLLPHAPELAAGPAPSPSRITGPMRRDSYVASDLVRLEQRTLRGGAASVMFRPAQGIQYDAWAFGYETKLTKRMNLETAPADGVVRGTVVVNPSGHRGSANARDWARSNVYNVEITLPDGQVLRSFRLPRNDPKATEYATTLDIEFPYQSGVTTMEVWPQGSARGGGYIEGRVYEIHSADQPWDAQAQQRKAQQHMADHPEVRWGTPYQEDDRKKHHVRPAPYPARDF